MANNDRAEVIFALTIDEKCEAALMAYEDLERPVRALEKVMRMGEQLGNLDDAQLIKTMKQMGELTRSREASSARTWAAISAFLEAAASVSKMFRPTSTNAGQRELAAPRAKHLRESYEVNYKSKIWDRTARDALDHFDARIDAWLESLGSIAFIDGNIGGPITKEKARDHLRYYDQTNKVVWIAGAKCELVPIAEEIRQIQARARELAHSS